MLYFGRFCPNFDPFMTQLTPKEQRPSHRMPKDSLFYERVVPALLIGMAIVLVGLVVLAAGILLGFISF